MRLVLLRFAARHPWVSVLIVVGLALALATGGIRWKASGEHTAADALEPRMVLNRPWFDVIPHKPRDDFKLLLFFGGGIGIYRNGSAFRFALEVFDFERQGDQLNVMFLQDKTKTATRFRVSHCSEKPPFDLCLDLAATPRGPRRYYGFDSDEEFSARLPWGPELVRAARAQAQVGRRVTAPE
jgi:hypothetical protein